MSKSRFTGAGDRCASGAAQAPQPDHRNGEGTGFKHERLIPRMNRSAERDGDGGSLPQARYQPGDLSHKLKAKYGGMDGEAEKAGVRWAAAPPNDVRRLQTLEDKNARLKRLLADAMLDNFVLKDLLGEP